MTYHLCVCYCAQPDTLPVEAIDLAYLPKTLMVFPEQRMLFCSFFSITFGGELPDASATFSF